MENLDFCCGHGLNFDQSTMVIKKFWPQSWSIIFDMTMEPGLRPNGQNIVVALTPPPPPYAVASVMIFFD